MLPDGEARELLTQRIGARRAGAEPGAVAELARLCGRLPLALAVAAARAAARPAMPLTAVAAELAGTASWLEALQTGDPVTDVRTVFSWSCQHLGPDPARLFRLLGVHPGPDITAPAAAALLGTGPDRARAALDALAMANLAAEHVPGRYGLHDLLRAYAAEQAAGHEPAAVRRTAISACSTTTCTPAMPPPCCSTPIACAGAGAAPAPPRRRPRAARWPPAGTGLVRSRAPGPSWLCQPGRRDRQRCLRLDSCPGR